MGARQVDGKVETFNIKTAHASVRVNGGIHFVPIAYRGVLKDGCIRPCSHEEQRQPLAPGARVKVNFEGPRRNRRIVAWASK